MPNEVKHLDEGSLKVRIDTKRCFTSGNMTRYFTFLRAAVRTECEQQRTPISQATLVNLKRRRGQDQPGQLRQPAAKCGAIEPGAFARASAGVVDQRRARRRRQGRMQQRRAKRVDQRARSLKIG